MAFWQWSRTASSNATADPTVGYSEGQAPSSLNDSARAAMARTAEYRDDIAGAIATGGTSTAYTVTSFQGFDSYPHANGKVIAFTPHTTNGATVTLNLDGLGTKPLRSAPSTELLAGTIIQGTPYTALYNDSDGAFYLSGYYGNAYNIPLGGGLPYIGTTAPNSSFVFPFGQAISRTTYSALFALTSTTFGTGDGSTTFNVPDWRGRVIAGVDNMGGSAASRLTSTYFGANASTLGAVGGGESSTLLTANLPAYTPTGTIANNITVAFNAANISSSSGGGNSITTGGFSGTGALNLNTASIGGSSTFTGVAQGGTSTPVRTVAPTITSNFILRVI